MTSFAFMLVLVPEPGLKNVEYKVLVKLAVHDFFGRLYDGRRALLVEACPVPDWPVRRSV